MQAVCQTSLCQALYAVALMFHVQRFVQGFKYGGKNFFKITWRVEKDKPRAVEPVVARFPLVDEFGAKNFGDFCCDQRFMKTPYRGALLDGIPHHYNGLRESTAAYFGGIRKTGELIRGFKRRVDENEAAFFFFRRQKGRKSLISIAIMYVHLFVRAKKAF